MRQADRNAPEHAILPVVESAHARPASPSAASITSSLPESVFDHDDRSSQSSLSSPAKSSNDGWDGEFMPRNGKGPYEDASRTTFTRPTEEISTGPVHGSLVPSNPSTNLPDFPCPAILGSLWKASHQHPDGGCNSRKETGADDKATFRDCPQERKSERPRTAFHDPLPGPPPSSDTLVAPELRVHPRRTQACPPQSECQGDGPRIARPPPALVRQDERKGIFVESLVDTTTQMIEVIWPLSAVPPVISGCDAGALASGGRSLIDLRTFVQEVLKRSKTSYSTLQVALYYLVLIRPHVPRHLDFTREQPDDSHAARAMQCGRRMFLAALILASKYLQDRNYSARAWSKISGLRVAEINLNERAFVQAIDYRLHVPDSRFVRWTEIVLKYSLGSTPPSSPAGPCRRHASDPSAAWRALVARLTPELDDVDLADSPQQQQQQQKPQQQTPRPERFSFETPSMSPPPLPGVSKANTVSWTSRTEDTSKPNALEPAVRNNTSSRSTFANGPGSPKIPQLPTPQMTPRTSAFYTPAAGVGCGPPANAMRGAMQQIQSHAFNRYAVEPYPCGALPQAPHQAHPWSQSTGMRRCRGRHPSGLSTSSVTAGQLPPRSSGFAASAASSVISSPESMVSDVSTLSSSSASSRASSRASSISSMGSGLGTHLALPHNRLAAQAARRCAELQYLQSGSSLDQDSPLASGVSTPKARTPGPVNPATPPCSRGSARAAILRTGRPPTPPPDAMLGLSGPLSTLGAAPESFERGSRPSAAASPDMDRDREAALALRALAKSGPGLPLPQPPPLQRKRSHLALCSDEPPRRAVLGDRRVASADGPLQAAVRAATRAPAPAGPEATVRPDPRPAQSFLLAPSRGANVRLPPPCAAGRDEAGDGAARKRVRCGQAAGPPRAWAEERPGVPSH